MDIACTRLTYDVIKNIGRLESRSAAQIVAHVSALTSAGISPRRNFIVCHVTPDIRPVFCTFGFENTKRFEDLE